MTDALPCPKDWLLFLQGEREFFFSGRSVKNEIFLVPLKKIGLRKEASSKPEGLISIREL